MASKPKRYVFLVDDEPIQNEMLKDYLEEKFTFDFKTFESGEEALKNMNLKPEIVVLDFHLNNHIEDAKNGLDVLKAIKEESPETEVVMISGQDKIDVAVDTMKYGAYDYVVKGESGFSRTENILNNISRLHAIQTLNQGYKNTILLLSIGIGLIILIAIYVVIIKPYLR